VQDQKVMRVYAIKDDIWIARDAHTAMSRIIDKRTDLWKITQRIDGGSDRSKDIASAGWTAFKQIRADAL
jgi:hypothetical protein